MDKKSLKSSKFYNAVEVMSPQFSTELGKIS